MTRWVISPGMPRSGTTYLWDNLTSDQNRENFCVPHTKEVMWHMRSHELDFESIYGQPDEQRWHLDIAPGYAMAPPQFLRVLDALPCDGTAKVIFCLRDPIQQAFAHYLHDLKAHVSLSVLERKTDGYYPFFSEPVLRHYAQDRSRMIKATLDKLGSNNCLLLNFHAMFFDPKKLGQMVADFLEIEPLNFKAVKSSPGGWLPRFVYGGEGGIEFTANGHTRYIPPSGLLLANGSFSRLIDDVDTSTAARFLYAQSSWTSSILRGELGALQKNLFDRDCSFFSEALDYDLSRDRPDFLTASHAEVDTKTFDKLAIHHNSIGGFLNQSVTT